MDRTEQNIPASGLVAVPTLILEDIMAHIK